MIKERYDAWMEDCAGLMSMEFLLLGNLQGLGILDIELIEEYPLVKEDAQSEEDRIKKLRHITLSELWIMGAYELVRMIDIIADKRKPEMDKEIKKKIKDTLASFTEVRIPLAKFQKRGQDRMFSGVASKYDFDKTKGIGWKIVSSDRKGLETKVFYRKDLADSLLELSGALTRYIGAEMEHA